MKIYFGKANPEEFSDLYEHNGNYFFYELELDQEEGTFKLSDTCNRSLPFDLKDVVPLINALSYVRDYSKAKSTADIYVDEALNKLSRMYGFVS